MSQPAANPSEYFDVPLPSSEKKPLSKTTTKASATQGTWVSWNGNVSHPFSENYQVIDESDLIARLRFSDKKVRMYGHRYSSADICAGNELLLDMTKMDRLLHVDLEKKEITIEPGMTLAHLCNIAEEHGWTLPCLPDIDAVTIGGALATGTHGTGREGQLLAQYMVHCHLVKADGSLLEIHEDDEIMPAVRLSLGTLGIMSRVTFRCVDNYTLHVKERPSRDEEWLTQLDDLLVRHEFVRILWLPHTDHGYLITADKIPADQNVIEQEGPRWLKYRRTASAWLYKWTHKFPAFTKIANRILFRLFFTSQKEHKGSLYQATVTKKRSSTMELAEWTIARSRFPALFEELKSALHDPANQAYAHVPMDIRFLQKDDTWLSYAYGEDCVTIGCVCRTSQHADKYEAFSLIEEIFLRHGGRPHWAKRFQAKHAELAPLFPQWEAFRALRRKMDPQGRFLNKHLAQIFHA